MYVRLSSPTATCEINKFKSKFIRFVFLSRKLSEHSLVWEILPKAKRLAVPTTTALLLNVQHLCEPVPVCRTGRSRS
jgi:hypothetical protein